MKEKFIELYMAHPGRVWGVLAGLFSSLIYLVFGFIDTLVVMGFILLGLYIGTKIERKEPVSFAGFTQWVDRLLTIKLFKR